MIHKHSFAAAALAQSVKRPELRPLKREVQQSRREFDCQTQHFSFGGKNLGEKILVRHLGECEPCEAKHMYAGVSRQIGLVAKKEN